MGGVGSGVGGGRGSESAGASYSAMLKEAPAQAAQALTSGAGRMEWPC